MVPMSTLAETAHEQLQRIIAMVFFWVASASIAVKLERLRSAETALLDLAGRGTEHPRSQSVTGRTGSITIQTFDTPIPASVVPTLPPSSSDHRHHVASTTREATKTTKTTTTTTTTACEKSSVFDGTSYVIHGVEVTSDAHTIGDTTPPLVLLHGYMNGGAYFYRNLMGLSRFFPKIYAIDQLGWGLSSRPVFPALTEHENGVNSSEKAIQTAENFFVESLEAWRKEHQIERMTLAGHSMGGLLGVAYTERYPQHVDRLILISPAGVPEESPALIEARKARTTWRFRLFELCFPLCSPGDVLRALPEWTGRRWMLQYVARRLPSITDADERVKLADYLYANNALPGSGEYCLPKLLKPSIFGRHPLQHRIPMLKIKSCTFLYGDTDWMDPNGGLMVEQTCAQRKLCGMTAPDVTVYTVSNAGHLLMLDNVAEFNNGMIMAVVGVNDEHTGEELLAPDAPRPTRLRLDEREIDSSINTTPANLRQRPRPWDVQPDHHHDIGTEAVLYP